MEKKNIIPKGFFSTVRNIITTKEALKDVTPVNWNNALKDRKNAKEIVKICEKETERVMEKWKRRMMD